MITLEEKEAWIRRYYPFCESYMKMALADRNKIPQLEIRLDKGSYTDHSIIHIGISELEENDEESLLRSVLFLIGHEVQHVRDVYIGERLNKKRKEDFIDKEKAVDDDSLPDLEDVNTHYDTQINLNEEARTYPANERMPFELKGQANVLKRKVEKIFHNMQKPILRGRRTGQLDAAMAYKLAMNQMDCFMKKGEVSEFDGCAYFLADNSGSMQGNRQENCCKALSKIEHAFQDVMPLKIVAFNADDCYSVRHQVLKNWSEKVSSNGSYNFLTHCYANGGNKDGYSIRVATEELLHRPERKKILIVLSDGLPSAYEKNDGEKDVNDAVRKARKAGISVISIFFGDDSERSTFVKMYEKNCIITEPEGIDAELVRLMKRFCFR